MEDIIVRIVVRLIVPFIQIYGVYVVLNGHLSPGGGFAGGAILGSSMLLFGLAFNLEEGSKKLSHDTSMLLESGGALLFGSLGILSILLGSNYLGNANAGFPLGTTGNLFSGGIIFIITMAIGVKVASTVITLFYNLAEGKAHD